MNTSVPSLFTSLFLTSACAMAGTLHVPADYDTLQDAVDAAADGDEILIGPGNWTVGFVPPSTPQVVDTLGKSLVIRSTDGPEKTSIDGEGRRRVITVSPNKYATVHLDGLTITGGDTDERGGGIYAPETNLTITNCIITGNAAYDFGAGVCCWHSNLVMERCTVSDNSGHASGGGLRCLGSGTVSISDCTFTSNRTWQYSGGAISLYGIITGSVTNCIISNNECTFGFGGGLSMWSGCQVNVANCTITGNACGGQMGEGGGISCRSACISTITDCLITGNTGIRGGGLYLHDRSEVYLARCEIKSNTAEHGGGIQNSQKCIVTLDNCVVSNNIKTGLAGGGILTDYWNPDESWEPIRLVDTFVCDNTPDQIDGFWLGYGTTEVSDDCPTCTGDATGDGVINVDDVLHVLSAWGGYDPEADVDDDGLVDVNDVLLLLSRFGTPCP